MMSIYVKDGRGSNWDENNMTIIRQWQLTPWRMVIGTLLGASLLLPSASALAQASPSPDPCPFGVFEVGVPFTKDAKRGASVCLDQGIGKAAAGIATLLTVLTVMAGLLAVVFGGYIYMTAAGNGSRVQLAKTWIMAGLSGILLAVLAFFILNLIGGYNFTNPPQAI